MLQNTSTFLNKICSIGLLVISLTSCKPLHVIYSEANSVKTSEESLKDDEVTSFVSSYKEQLDEAMEIRLAILKEDLNLEQPESNLGNHIAEVTFWSAEHNLSKDIDFAICNYGGLRIPFVAKGPLKVKHAYQIMPFDNYVVTMELPGNIVNQLFQHMAKVGGWPLFNAAYSIKNEQAIEITIGDSTLNVDKTYTVAITDYLANGGDKLSFLKEFSYDNANVYLRDAIMNYWKAQSAPIEVVKDGRVTNK